MRIPILKLSITTKLRKWRWIQLIFLRSWLITLHYFNLQRWKPLYRRDFRQLSFIFPRFYHIIVGIFEIYDTFPSLEVVPQQKYREAKKGSQSTQPFTTGFHNEKVASSNQLRQDVGQTFNTDSWTVFQLTARNISPVWTSARWFSWPEGQFLAEI